MHAMDHIRTIDDEALIDAIRSGAVKFSGMNPAVVDLAKRLSEQRMSAAEIALTLHLSSKSVVLGMFHRAKIRTVNRPGPAPGHKRTPRGPDKRPRAVTTARRPAPPPDQNSGFFTLPVEMSPEATARVRARRRHVPQCLWADCKEPPMSQGKPYCRHHHLQSGATL